VARSLTIKLGTSQTLFNVSWLPPEAPGATSVVYDVLRAASSTDFLSASCVATNTAQTLAADLTTPSPGESFYYLVRVQNDCGGNLGSDSAGQQRPGGDCD